MDKYNPIEPIIKHCSFCKKNKNTMYTVGAQYYYECDCGEFLCYTCKCLPLRSNYEFTFLEHTFGISILEEKGCVHREKNIEYFIKRNFPIISSWINYDLKTEPKKLGKHINDNMMNHIRQAEQHIIPDLAKIIKKYFLPIDFEITHVKYRYYKPISDRLSTLYVNY